MLETHWGKTPLPHTSRAGGVIPAPTEYVYFAFPRSPHVTVSSHSTQTVNCVFLICP